MLHNKEHFAERGKSRLSNINKEMSKIKKMSAGIQKFYNRYINYYNNQIEQSEEEQDEITNRYGK
ncbi:hypothetical protein DBB36_17145 [Flavobacterium sp. WLB]|nr:hypothetical protein AKO67_02825 [Flavobacterium sp. VMW]OWU92621.1 hypothetical protein APR43_00745 [Flavobacterium sp. NLM]PUU68796.1 hypothetical protein DBB36_17145 [Flavobacterium sp. WLB]